MRPRPAFIALILFALAGASAMRVVLDGDLARLLPDAAPELLAAARLLERTALVDIEGSADDAALFRSRLSEKYEVRGLPDQGDLLNFVDMVRERAPLYLTDTAAIEARLAEIPERIPKLARHLLEPDAGDLGSRVDRDPLGIGDLALSGLASLTAGLKDARIDESGITNRDGTHRLLIVRPGFPVQDVQRTRKLLEDIEEAADGITVHHFGVHRASFDNERSIRSDGQRSTILGALAVVVLAFLVFRKRPISAVLAILPAVFGGVFGLGIYAMFDPRIAAAVVGFGAVLLGITIDFAIHVFCSRRVPVRGILIGATTTSAAFFCLNFSAVPGLRAIGTLGATGVLSAALFAVFVLRPRGDSPSLALAPVARFLQSRVVFFVLLAAIPVVLYGLTLVRFEANAYSLHRLSPEAQRDEDVIQEVWGSALSPINVLVDGPDVQTALRRNDAVAAELERTAVENAAENTAGNTTGNVTAHSFASLTAVLPSHETQARRLKVWRTFWTPDRIRKTRNALAAATKGTPFRADAFEPFLEWVAAEPAFVSPSDVPRPLWEDRLIEDQRGVLISTQVYNSKVESIDGAIVVNPAAVVRGLVQLVGDEMTNLGLYAAGAVLLVTGLWFGRPRPVLMLMAPLLLATGFSLGVFGWLDIPITLANAGFIVFLFGLSVDYGVFLIVAREKRAQTGEDRVAESDGAVVLCALTTCVGFSALLTASHPVFQSISATALIGVGSALLLMQALVPRFWKEPGEPRTIRDLFAFEGPMVSNYAPSKGRRDPGVEVFAQQPEARSTLVAGCGYGIMSAARLLRYPNEALTGVDADVRKLSVASRALRRFPNAAFVEGDLRTMDIRNPTGGQFEFATLMDVLHYWPESTQEQMLRQVTAAIEPGGRLLFRDGCSDHPEHTRISGWEKFALRIGFTRGTGLFFRTEAAWRTLLEDCDLEVEPIHRGPGSNVTFLCRKPNS